LFVLGANDQITSLTKLEEPMKNGLHWDLFASLNGIFAADRTEPIIVMLPKTSIRAATNYSGRPLVVPNLWHEPHF
jgi:hypothetical protein